VILRRKWIVEIVDEVAGVTRFEPDSIAGMVNSVSSGLLEADERGVIDCICCNRWKPQRFAAIALARAASKPETILLAFLCPGCTPSDDAALIRLTPMIIETIWPGTIIVPAANLSPESGQA
jgi:hypothetical protein